MATLLFVELSQYGNIIKISMIVFNTILLNISLIFVVVFPPASRPSNEIIPVIGKGIYKINEDTYDNFKLDPLSTHSSKYHATRNKTDIKNQSLIDRREKDTRGEPDIKNKKKDMRSDIMDVVLSELNY